MFEKSNCSLLFVTHLFAVKASFISLASEITSTAKTPRRTRCCFRSVLILGALSFDTLVKTALLSNVTDGVVLRRNLAALRRGHVLSVGRLVFFLPVGRVVLAQPIGELCDLLSKTTD